MPIVSISLPEKLLEDTEASIKKCGFASRSEIIRQALRRFIEESKNLQTLEGEIVATITVIYGKAEKKVEMLEIQHEFDNVISTFLHAHVDSSNCLEVMVVRGEAATIRKLVDTLNTNEEIKQVKVAVLGKPS